MTRLLSLAFLLSLALPSPAEPRPLDELRTEFVQLKELLSKYGKIASITFDGWGNCGTDWTHAQYKEIYDHVKSLQPETLVADLYQVQRAMRPKYKHQGITFKKAYKINDFFLFEEPMKLWAPEGNPYASAQGAILQKEWFWKKSFPTDQLMSVDEIVNKRLKVLEKRNCVFQLNVAPNPDGLLDDNVIQRLKEVGAEIGAASPGKQTQ